MPVLLHLMMVGVWGMTFVIHTRRLLRLARVNQLRHWDDSRRLGLNRIWWWLGQDEFWHGVRPDCLKAIELTTMIFLIAWGMSQ
ncbi:MAG: hypothetical protein HGA45_10305 [Chloroflexales bacterium]|nr:hypothetical protein [Chloroflexales bacterium]